MKMPFYVCQFYFCLCTCSVLFVFISRITLHVTFLKQYQALFLDYVFECELLNDLFILWHHYTPFLTEWEVPVTELGVFSSFERKIFLSRNVLIIFSPLWVAHIQTLVDFCGTVSSVKPQRDWWCICICVTQTGIHYMLLSNVTYWFDLEMWCVKDVDVQMFCIYFISMLVIYS